MRRLVKIGCILFFQLFSTNVKTELEHTITIGLTKITIVVDDIIKQDVEALVNAANPGVCFGPRWAGITKAISDAVGGNNLDKLDQAVKETKQLQLSKIRNLHAGEVIITPGFGKLLDKKLVHALAPDLRGDVVKDPQLLQKTYVNVFYSADAAGIKSLALPLLGAGVYGWTAHESAYAAACAIKEFLQQNHQTSLQEIRLVIYDYNQYKQALPELISIK